MATPKDLPRDIGGFIRDLRHNARISLRQLAERAGVSNPYLSQIERGLRKPSAEVLAQIAGALRVSTPLMYLRAGLLDEKDGHGVLAAIAADTDLTMAQKQSLTQIYETFRRENERGGEAEAGTGPPTRPAPPKPPPGPQTTSRRGHGRNRRHPGAGDEAAAKPARSAAPPQTGPPPRPRGESVMTDQKQSTRIPTPLYAAAGAGDLAYEQLRKLPAVQNEPATRPPSPAPSCGPRPRSGCAPRTSPPPSCGRRPRSGCAPQPSAR